MKNNKFMIAVLFSAALIIVVSPLSAESIELESLVKQALLNNTDIIASDYDLSAGLLDYESSKASQLPSLGFSTDTGNSPLYKYSDANEFSTSPFQSARYQRHRIGGGLELNTALPSGGSLGLTGSGSLDFSLEEDASDWNYFVGPSAAFYLRQPLFVDRLKGSIIDFGSLRSLDDLAVINVEQAEINSMAIRNSIILAITSTSYVVNNLAQTYDVLQKRIELAEKRLELAYEDEGAGRLSSLDRLSEELQLRKQKEALLEIEYQIESALKDLENLTGSENLSTTDIKSGILIPDAENLLDFSEDVNPFNSSDVKLSEAARRSIELAASAVQNGSEPVFEVSGLFRRSDTDSAADFEAAFDDAFSAEIDLSVSLALSFEVFDWGEVKKARSAEREKLNAAEKRLESAMKNAEVQLASALRNLKLIEEKAALVSSGLDYDRSLLEREQVRFESGLTSELSVKTVELDLLDRQYQLAGLNDEKFLAMLELYNMGGLSLAEIITGDEIGN